MNIHEQSALATAWRGITHAPQSAWRSIALEPFRNPFRSRSTKFSAGTNLNLLSPAFGFDSNDNLTRTTWGASLAYKLVPVLGAVVDATAEGMAEPVLEVVDSSGNVVARSDKNENDSPLLVAIRNSQRYYGIPLMKLWGYSRLLHGMTFVEIVRNDSGYAKGFRWLNPNAVTIYSTAGTYSAIDYLQYWGSMKPAILHPAHRDDMGRPVPTDFLYARAFDPTDDLHGYSLAMRALADAQAQIDFKKFSIAYYTNGGMPGMILTTKEHQSLDEVKALTAFWRQEFRGVDNFFKTHIGNLPMDAETFEPPSLSGPVESVRYNRQEIYINFRTPPEVVADTENNPYQFNSEMKNGFMRQVIKPINDSIDDFFNQYVIREFEPEGYTLRRDYSPYDTISETQIKKAEQERADWQSGRISYNQFRQAGGYSTIPKERDFIIIPSGYTVVPVAEIGNPLPEPTQPALPSMGASIDDNVVDVEPERPHQEDAIDELRAWERKVTQKKPSVWFETHHVDDLTAFHIRSRLHDDMTSDDLKAVFTEARHMVDGHVGEWVDMNAIKHAVASMEAWS